MNAPTFQHFQLRLSEFLPEPQIWLWHSEIYALWLLGRDERQVAADVRGMRKRERAAHKQLP